MFFTRLQECEIRDIALYFLHRSREAYTEEMLKHRSYLEALKFYLGDLIYGAEEILLKDDSLSTAASSFSSASPNR